MKFKNQDILYELQELAPTLAQMNRTNPFAVPQNYFQHAPQTFDSDLNNATDAIFPAIEQTDKASAFAVPQHYFDDLHDQILLTIVAHTLPDQPDAPFLLKMGKQNGMSLPDNYFNELHESVMSQITEEKSATQLNLSTQSSFKVPDGYFDNFANNLLNKIQTIEAETEPATPTLDQIGKKTGFTVPINYFEQAAELIQQRIQRLNTKIVPLHPQQVTHNTSTNIRAIVRYSLSVAAMLAMFVAGMQFLNQPQNDHIAQTDNNRPKLLAFNDQALINMSQGDLLVLMEQKVSAEDAKAYITENIDEFDDVLEDEEVISKMNISDASLEDLNINRKAAEEMLKEMD